LRRRIHETRHRPLSRGRAAARPEAGPETESSAPVARGDGLTARWGLVRGESDGARPGGPRLSGADRDDVDRRPAEGAQTGDAAPRRRNRGVDPRSGELTHGK